MAQVTKTYTFSSGSVIVASEHNSNFDDIYDEFNGNIDNTNIKSSAAIAATKLNLATIAQTVAFTGNVTFNGTTIADLGTVTTADINGGTIDDVVIGGNTAVDASFASMNLSEGVTINEISNDGTLAGDSDTAIPTEKAIKTYVDTEIANILSI